MKLIFLLSFLCTFVLLVESTINICIPLEDSNTKSTEALFEEVLNDFTKKFALSDEFTTINVGHVELDNLTHPAISVNGTLDNVAVYNIDQIELCLLNYDQAQLNLFNLTFLNIGVEGDYNITGMIGDLFDIFGIGPFKMAIHNFSIAANNFNVMGDTELCVTINLDINIFKVKGHFNNLMNDVELEDLLNRGIEAILPETLSILWSELKEAFDKPIEDFINGILHRKKIATLLTKMILFRDNKSSGLYCYSSF